MADERDPRIDLTRPPPVRGGVRPVAKITGVRPRDAARAAYEQPNPETPKRTDSAHVAVRQVMSKPALTLDLHASLADAAALMQDRGIDHVPVIEDQTLVGLVTRSDLVTRMLRTPDGWRALTLERVMTRSVTTILPTDSLRDAAEQMIGSHHGGLPVVTTEGMVVGFLAARDLLSVLVRRAPLSLWV